MKHYTMDYVVDYRDVDQYFDLKAESLLQILSTVSTYDEILGFGMKPGYMAEWDMAWVLYQWKIELNEPKQYARKIRIHTLPVLKKDIYSYRYYLLEDLEGNEIGKALSQWVAVDLRKRRIGRIPQPVVEIINGDGQLNEYQDRITKVDLKPLRRENVDFDFEWKIPVLYSDIDSNQHVNNAMYARWATETMHAYDSSWMNSKYHNSINIVYKKEKQLGGSVISKVYLEGDRSYHEIIDEDGTLLTLIEIKWVDRARHQVDFSDYDFAAVML